MYAGQEWHHHCCCCCCLICLYSPPPTTAATTATELLPLLLLLLLPLLLATTATVTCNSFKVGFGVHYRAPGFGPESHDPVRHFKPGARECVVMPNHLC